MKFQLVFQSIFNSELKWKRSRAEPSWKSFSSSYGSGQLGSDSSLLNTLTKQWTEDVCETLHTLTQTQSWIWKELSYENMNNCLSQSFNNDWSWCEKKHQSMLKNDKHVSKHISFLVIQLKNLSHEYQLTTSILKIFA